MTSSKKDFLLVAIIGAAVGLLSQPIMAGFLGGLSAKTGLGEMALRAGVFFAFLILAPLALAIAGFIGKKVPAIYQFGKFAAVGTLNSFVDIGVFNLEILMLGGEPGKILYAILKSVSFLVATTNSYFWNKYWTFQSHEKTSGGEATKFYSIAIAGWFINAGIATYVAKFMAPPAFISADVWTRIVAPVVGIVCVLFWNFFGYKIFVFKKEQTV